MKLTVRTTIANCPTGGGSGGGGTGGSGAQAAAMWPLDEVTGTLANDATGNGHDGTYGSGVNLGGPGSPKNGNAAAVFDGGGVTVQYSPDLNPATYTVEAWVDPNSVNGYMDQGTAARSIACSRDAGHGYMLYADNYTGVPQFAFHSLYLVAPAGSLLALELRRTLQAAGGSLVVITDPAMLPKAEAVFELLSEQPERSVVGLNASGQARELELRLRIRFRLHRQDGTELIAPTEILQQRELSYNETIALAKEAEEALLYRDMRTDLVQQLVRRLAAAKA